MPKTKLLVSYDQNEDSHVYTLVIPRFDMIMMSITDLERKDLNESFNRGSISETLSILAGIVEKIEAENRLRDLDKMFVDHLVTDLEKRSVGDILKFISKYAGWNDIVNFALKQDAKRGQQNGDSR